MKEKITWIGALLLLLLSQTAFTQTKSRKVDSKVVIFDKNQTITQYITPNPFKKPSLAIMDIITSSYNKQKTDILTDAFRSNLFKTGRFDLLETGQLKIHKLSDSSDYVKIGKALKANKVFICKIEKFLNTVIIDTRIVDTKTSMIDFSENTVVKDENNIFSQIQEIALHIDLYYQNLNQKHKYLSPEQKKQKLIEKWKTLGANDKEAVYFQVRNLDPKDYLSIRQYDISFTPKEYIDFIEKNWDISALKTFLQSGINYHLAKLAMEKGIFNLEHYKDFFATYDLSFKEYLDAYEHNFVTAQEYNKYREGFKLDHVVVGAGGVADSIPIGNAPFKFLLLKTGWEHYWTKYQRNFFKLSTEAGSYLMNALVPVPYFQLNTYFGTYPYYFKLAAGGHAELIVGGHVGAVVKIGFELYEKYEATVLVTFTGTQPTVSYVNNKRNTDSEYVPINYPYYGVMFNYKF